VWAKEGKNGDYYYIIRETKMPSVISEFAFIDSKDADAMDTQEELLAGAKAIAKAVCRQLSTEFKEIKSQKQPEQPQHWGTPLLRQLEEKGIISSLHTLDALVIWAELATVILKILK